MQKPYSLSELRMEYADGRMDRKMLEGLIFQYLLDNYERYQLFKGNREQWGDFVSWLYPRLRRTIDYYHDTGSSFDAYIYSIVRWAGMEYKAKEEGRHITEYTWWKARAQEMETNEQEPEYLFGQAEDKTENPFLLRNYTPRQILFLVLKSYYLVNDDFLDRAALAAGVDRHELRALVERLHKMREKHEESIRIRRQRLYNQYYRCLVFQKRFSIAIPGTALYIKLKILAEKASIRFKAMRERLNKIRTDATNAEIGKILNIPKGTIDSAFYYIRKKAKKADAQPDAALADAEKDRYDDSCSVTAIASTQATPQMSSNT